MLKFVIGLLLGLAVASAAADRLTTIIIRDAMGASHAIAVKVDDKGIAQIRCAE